tara:strand:- start:570 stop:1091 length:522 start_codon:yes stop_codon:yes gene_type:complete
MYKLKRGQINFMVELIIGSFLILLIVASSYYFAEKSNIEATADVYAENTESNCYVTLNTLMQSDQFLDGKTSTQLSDRTNLEDKLKIVRDKLETFLPNSDFSLTLFDECEDFRGECDKDEESKISKASSSEFNALDQSESCNYPIPIECDPNAYVENPEGTQCKIFMEMRLNY